MSSGPRCRMHCKGGGSCCTSQKVRGGPAPPDPVSMVMEPESGAAGNCLAFGLGLELSMSLSWGLGWGWGNLGSASPVPLVPRRCPLGPTGRSKVSPGRVRQLVQGPLLAGVPVMAPRIQAFKSEPRPHPE